MEQEKKLQAKSILELVNTKLLTIKSELMVELTDFTIKSLKQPKKVHQPKFVT